jgi:TonB family protein
VSFHILVELRVFMKFDAIVMALFVVINSQLQIAEFEEQALASVQRRLASSFDEGLPERTFARWFKEIVGERAGVIWQLSECEGPIDAPEKKGIPACAEANAVLPNDSKVVVRFRVGTFKGELQGNPAFFSAVVEYKHQFYQVQRLRDLPKVMHRLKSQPVTLPAINAKRTLFKPDLQLPPISTPAYFPEISSDMSMPPVPPIRYQQLQKVAEGVAQGWALTRIIPVYPVQKVTESVAQGWALTRVIPVYPASARKMNAYGPVEVRIIISREGKVIEAAAISGHPALRRAAVETARRWAFKPTTIDGAPIKMESILTFVFARGSHLGQLWIKDIKRPKDTLSSPQ